MNEEEFEKMLSCHLNCQGCEKTLQQCRIDMWKCINVIFRKMLSLNKHESLTDSFFI